MKLLPVLSYYNGEDGTYCSVLPNRVTRDWLLSACAEAASCGCVVTAPGELHTTVIHSTRGLNLTEQHQAHDAHDLSASRDFAATAGKFIHWAGHDDTGYVVFEVDSPELTELNSWLRSTFDMPVSFDDYLAHVSIVTDAYAEGEASAAELVEKLNALPRPERLGFTGFRMENLKG